MNNFYEKKQIELTEEVEFLARRKKEIEKLSDEKRAEIITELNKLVDLKNEENAIIRRFEYLNKAELGIYLVFLPHHVFISSVNRSISNIQKNVKLLVEDDDNE